MKKHALIATTALLLSAVNLHAEENYAIGVSAGTLGGDLEYSRMLSPQRNLALRVSLGGLSYSSDYDDTDAHYETDLSLKSLGAVVEYHPNASGFYIGVGAYYQDNSYELVATPQDGEYEFNGHTYAADALGSVYGETDGLNKLVPYVGIGYDNALFGDGQWFFTAKLGAWYHGTPTVNLTAKDCALDDYGSPLTCDDLRQDLRKEERDINEDIQDYTWWPVLQIGLSYRF